MPLNVLTASYRAFDTSQIEAIAQYAETFTAQLRASHSIAGFVLLSTCNRFELYLDSSASTAHALAADFSHGAAQPLDVLSGPMATRHLYEVAAGLDSMVVGEREIVGQLRRALDEARANGTTTKLIETIWRGALRMARRISAQTSISAAGRSIVGTALDMVEQRAVSGAFAVPTWEHASVLLVGTGAYAGATVAALRERGATNIAVWSASGRATAFAAHHDVEATLTLDLSTPHVVILCRGIGSPVITAAMLAQIMPTRSPIVLIDLARRRDVEAEASTIPGVWLITLDSIRAHVPAIAADAVAQVREIVESSLTALTNERRERAMDPVIAGIHTQLAELLEAERAKFHTGDTIDAAEAISALEHFTSVLAYRYARAARAAATSYHAHEFHHAAQLVFGIDLPLPDSDADVAACPYQERDPLAASAATAVPTDMPIPADTADTAEAGTSAKVPASVAPANGAATTERRCCG
ncbi:MAG: glutamyl-tRNA reductase [Arcanobacterium sp.]|nr:glutamyl-tRNA reductase [Arcanobacterium sp.]